MTRVPATEITEAVVGRVLVDFSHVGENPQDRPRYDQMNGLGAGLDLGDRKITAVRHTDVDNHVAIIVGPLLTRQVWEGEDENGVLPRGARRIPARDETGLHLRVLVEPLEAATGGAEIGFDEQGWIEVED